MDAPPFYVVLIVQFVSVIGDAFGQRCSRKIFSSSSRRMLMGLTVVSALQILVILGILQAALPRNVTSAIYNGSQIVPCYQEVDFDGQLPDFCSSNPCTVVECPTQGPGSMFNSIRMHPLLLLNGLMNVAYYTGEVLLYHEPLGLVLIVLAALSSSFLINPVGAALGLPDAKSIAAPVLVLGIVGSLFCVIEKRVHGFVSLRHLYRSVYASLQKRFGVESEFSSPAGEALISPINEESKIHHRSFLQHLRYFLKVFVPFLILAGTYSLWFVTQKLFNQEYRTNVFGYTSIDQILAPLYLWPLIFAIDLVPPLRGALVDESEKSVSAWASLMTMIKEASANKGEGWVTLFFYRLFINSRAMAYFYMGVIFDLQVVYVELTLTRVLLSWLVSIVLCAAVPRFIDVQLDEKLTVFHPGNLTLKLVGSCMVLAALFLINQ